MTPPEATPSRAKARVIWIAALLLGSGLLLLTAPAWASFGAFAGIPTDTGVDTDTDNRFEFLQVNVTVDVIVGGDFTVEGRLYDSSGSPFITNNSTAFFGGVGTHLVSLNFEGRDIFGSRIDGPYRVELDLLDDTLVLLLDSVVHFTSPYSYVSFGPIFAFTPPHSDAGLDTDGNTFFNFIQVNISANTSLPGFFFVFGGIFSSSGIMDFKIKILNLTAGDHIIPINFSGVGAFISGNDGPYDVLLSAGVIDCGRDRSGEGDTGNHTTADYFFTEFEFAIKRDLTGSVTNGTTGQPVANETVWLANASHRWLTSFETNATGNFSFVAFVGDFILLAGADGLQDEAVPVTIVGDTSVNVTLGKEATDISEIDLNLTDWGNVTVHTDIYDYGDNQSQRFFVDQFAGNGDLYADANESDDWLEVFRACFTPFNDTTGQFEVDGIPFELVNGTFVMGGNITGLMTSTAPILTTQDMNFTAQSPIPPNVTHEVFLRVEYDDENETEVNTLTFPSTWVLDSFWPVSNVTVGPLNYNTITIDPLGRPSGDPPSVGVVMNATLDATPPVVSNVSASPDPAEVFGSVAIAATATDNSGVASVSVNITDPSGGTVCNCSMTPAGSDIYSYTAAFGALGVYNFTIWAEDDGGLFTSASGNFAIQDTTPPSVGVPAASPDPQEAGSTVNFAVAVSDNFQLDTVTIAIVDPDAIPVGNFTMTFEGGEGSYAQAFTKLGVYTMTVWASDTSDNFGSNGHTFTIADTNAPQINNVSATPDPVEVFGSVTITANVSDNSGVAEVWVNITDPGGSTVDNFTMSGLGGEQYAYAAAYASLGTFSFTVWAVDDGGIFSSAMGTFAVRDTTLPTVGVPSASPSPQQAGRPVDFSVTVSDNFAVGTVTIAIRDPANAFLRNLTMIGVAGTYTYADTFTDTGTYTYTIWATDASGNLASRSGTFVIQDTEPPLAVISGPTEVDVDVSFSLDAGGSSDNNRVANYTWDLGDGTMAYGPTVTHAYDEAGDYTVTLTVRDESGNEDTATLPITVLAAAPDGGGFLSGTTLYALLAALAVAGIAGGVLYWRRGARVAGPRGPPTRPEGKAQKKPSKKASKKPPEEPPEPALDELDQEIEDLLKP